MRLIFHLAFFISKIDIREGEMLRKIDILKLGLKMTIILWNFKKIVGEKFKIDDFLILIINFVILNLKIN